MEARVAHIATYMCDFGSHMRSSYCLRLKVEVKYVFWERELYLWGLRSTLSDTRFVALGTLIAWRRRMRATMLQYERGAVL
jgi:hypothetical protein